MPRPGGLEDYEVLYKIGSGSYGTCRKIRRRKDGKLFVWKELDYGNMTESEKQMLVSEVNLLRELKHPHIVRYYDRIIDRTNTKLYIIMEYCESGDLATLISHHRRNGTCIPEDFIWKIFAQLTSALRECHRRKSRGDCDSDTESGRILHRDIKPANCFLDRNRNVKLGDFGLARVLQHDTSFAKTFVGSPYYISPEVWQNKKYNEKTDIWSLGCLCYELCALHPPFLATNQRELSTKIKSGKFSRIPSHYSNELDEVIGSMLRVVEDRRPSIDDLMEHPKIADKVKNYFSSPKTGSPTGERKHDVRNLEISDREKAAVEKEAELQKREKELALREKELEKKENELVKKEREVERRERELEKKDFDVQKQLKMAEDKFERAENLIAEAREARLKPKRILNEFQPFRNVEEAPSPQPCLVKAKKEMTPRKSVHFDEKRRLSDENRFVRRPRVFQDLNSKMSELDLKDKLHRAKLRQFDPRRPDGDERYKTRQLMGFR